MALRVHNPSGGSYVASARPFAGATSLAAGSAGLVPGPAAGQENQVLYGSGTFGPINASNVYVADTSNICGEGVNEVVTLQRLISTIATKLQQRTIFNYTGPSSGSSGESGDEQEETTPEVFQKEYVVDTYGLVGDTGESVSIGQLTSALADEMHNRTVWNYVEDEEAEEPAEAENNNEVTNNNSSEPEQSGDPVEESEPETEPSNEDDSLKDQMLNMD